LPRPSARLRAQEAKPHGTAVAATIAISIVSYGGAHSGVPIFCRDGEIRVTARRPHRGGPKSRGIYPERLRLARLFRRGRPGYADFVVSLRAGEPGAFKVGIGRCAHSSATRTGMRIARNCGHTVSTRIRYRVRVHTWPVTGHAAAVRHAWRSRRRQWLGRLRTAAREFSQGPCPQGRIRRPQAIEPALAGKSCFVIHMCPSWWQSLSTVLMALYT
jgi:hypothetical protein